MAGLTKAEKEILRKMGKRNGKASVAKRRLNPKAFSEQMRRAVNTRWNEQRKAEASAEDN